MIDTKDLYVGMFYQITNVSYSGIGLFDRVTHYTAKGFDNKPRLFFKQDQFHDVNYVDIITGNVYKKYASYSHKKGDMVVDIKSPICSIQPNIPTAVNKRTAYLLAVKMAGVELTETYRPRLGRVFKKR